MSDRWNSLQRSVESRNKDRKGMFSGLDPLLGALKDLRGKRHEKGMQEKSMNFQTELENLKARHDWERDRATEAYNRPLDLRKLGIMETEAERGLEESRLRNAQQEAMLAAQNEANRIASESGEGVNPGFPNVYGVGMVEYANTNGLQTGTGYDGNPFVTMSTFKWNNNPEVAQTELEAILPDLEFYWRQELNMYNELSDEDKENEIVRLRQQFIRQFGPKPDDDIDDDEQGRDYGGNVVRVEEHEDYSAGTLNALSQAIDGYVKRLEQIDKGKGVTGVQQGELPEYRAALTALLDMSIPKTEREELLGFVAEMGKRGITEQLGTIRERLRALGALATPKADQSLELEEMKLRGGGI